MSVIPQSIAYKESGIPWVGKIPEHWEVKRAKNIFKEMKRPVKESDEIITCFRDGVVTLRKNRRIDGFTNSLKEIGYQGIQVDDLVIHSMDAFAGAIGVSDSNGKATPVYIVCTPYRSNLAYTKYYAFLLRKMASSDFILSLAKGIRERSTDFRYSDFGDLRLPLPPIQEQQAIADFLDKKTRQIEEFITKKQKLITLLEEKKQTLINQCVTQGLDSSTPLKDSGVEWLGKIPTHWEVRKLKYVVSLRNQKEGESDFRIGLENIESKTGRFIQADESAFDDEGIGFFEGDVLFGKLRPYLAKVFLADRNGICVSEFLVLKSEGILNRFLKFLMLSGFFIEVVNSSTYGTKMPRANWEFIGNLKIPIPPLEEQKAIAEYLDTQIEKIDLAICKIKSQINLIKEYKTTLISEAVCGRIGVEGNA